METQNVTEVAPTTMSQKEAVYTAATKVVGITKEGGPSLYTLLNKSKETRAQVRQVLVDSFVAGSVRLSKTKSEADLRKYASGLINHWAKRDSRFGYVPTAPTTEVASDSSVAG